MSTEPCPDFNAQPDLAAEFDPRDPRLPWHCESTGELGVFSLVDADGVVVLTAEAECEEDKERLAFILAAVNCWPGLSDNQQEGHA